MTAHEPTAAVRTDAASAPTGGHRAALVLHALQRRDRAWLLARLDPVQRARIDGLLGELDALGVHFDAPDIEELLAMPVVVGPAEGPTSPAADWRLRLPGEPDWVIAALEGNATSVPAAAVTALRDAAADGAGPMPPDAPGERPERPKSPGRLEAASTPPPRRRWWQPEVLRWLR